MEHITWTIGIGALTGLIVSGIVLIIGQFTVKVVLPWYENLVYHDVKIEGRWYGTAQVSGIEVTRVWIISRQGHNIAATVTSTSGPDVGQVFHVTGSFKNLLLTATYVHSDQTNTARGTYTFKLVGDGHKFDGVIAYYATGSEKVSCGPYTLTRSESGHTAPKASA
ncbi:MAG: hypothetical protein Q8N00_12600 [Nitrospirota bacterium]|nr:hypothetical protein [Nitrospirota bacterium]MDP3599482.1 hypothetical protein [Nitrospirota bacterium]